MNYATIKDNDIANGDGVRVSLFVSGCSHHCKGCFNQETWDFNYGEPFTEEVQNKIIEMLEPKHIQGLTLLGGEPFEVPNQQALLPFLKAVRKRFGNHKDIWCYTGYTLEKDLLSPSRVNVSETMPMLSLIDVLVDGEFIEEQKDISLQFRGSSNQRIIDIPATLKMGFTLLYGRPSKSVFAVVKEVCYDVDVSVFETRDKAIDYMNYCVKDFKTSETYLQASPRAKEFVYEDAYSWFDGVYEDNDSFYIHIEERELY